MKKNFRKIISLLCTVALLASSLTVILSGGVLVSAADTTYYSGAYDVSGASLVPSVMLGDETFENIYKVQVTNSNEKTGRKVLGFANAANNDYCEMELGKTYYAMYDIYIESLTGTINDTALYYGKNANDNGKQLLSSKSKTGSYKELSAINLNAVGKWQTKEVRFTYADEYVQSNPQSSPNKVPYDCKHVFLTIYPGETGSSFIVYFKNLRIYKADTKVTYYDNGQKYVEYQNAGDDITRKGENALGNERLMGWYTEPDFTSEEYRVTEIPAVNDGDGNNVYLFARYPSTVIDFNLIRGKFSGGAYSIGTDHYINVTDDGIAEVRTDDPNGGSMIPAYDYDRYGTQAKFFQFGVTDDERIYRMTFFYQNATAPDDKDVVHFIPATCYGSDSGMWRIGSSVQNNSISSAVKNSSETYCFTVNITYGKPNTGNYNNIVLNQDDTLTKASLAIRGYDIDIVKIIITEISSETGAYRGDYGFNYLYYGKGKGMKMELLKKGTNYKMPEFPDTEDATELFAGWYDSSYVLDGRASVFTQIKEDPNDNNSKVIGVELAKDLTPKDCLVGDGKDHRFDAIWVPKEVKVNFTGGFNTGTNYIKNHSNNHYCSACIWYDTEEKAMWFQGTNSKWEEQENGYRFILYDDNGKPVSALEGVDYEIKIEYKVTGADTPAKIAILRDCVGTQNPCGVTGSSYNGPLNNDKKQYFLWQDTAATTERTSSSTISVTAKNTMDYINNGASVSRPFLKNVFAISPRSGKGYIYSVTVKALRYHAHTYIDHAEVKYDYENNKVMIKTDKDYELKYGSLKVYNIINATDKANPKYEVKEVLCDKSTDHYYDLTKVLTDNGLDLEHAVITAETVYSKDDDAPDNVVPAGRSVRPQAPGVTAGIRFKARLSNTTIGRYEDLYFAIAPKKVLDYAKAGTMAEMLNGECANLAVIGYAKQGKEEEPITYQFVDNSKGRDLQCILTGIDGFLDAPMYFALIGTKKEEDGTITITELTHDVFSYSNYNS